jgi:hypothetical protein
MQFLEEWEKAGGYAPTRENYARWESGAAHPSDESMARLTAFWNAVPDETVAAPLDPIAALVEELRLWRLEDRQRIAELEAMVDGLLERSPAVPDIASATAPHAHRKTAQ